jgi:hypothetical protein
MAVATRSSADRDALIAFVNRIAMPEAWQNPDLDVIPTGRAAKQPRTSKQAPRSGSAKEIESSVTN